MLLAGAGLLAGCSGHSAKGPAARYLAIALPADRQLDDDVDSYAGSEHDNLPAAESDLRKEAATELAFDEDLLRIAFPVRIAATATALVAANNQRIALIRRQARAATIADLVALDKGHKAADAAVEVQVRQIREELGLPPPDTG